MREDCWIICYDISDPKRLYRVAKALREVGTRRQWSVFECWLSAFALARLCRQLGRLIDRDCDSVRLYPISGASASELTDSLATYFIV